VYSIRVDGGIGHKKGGKKMGNKGNRFEVGSGVYTCEVCGKRTRSTGRGDNENVGLCAKCYDEAGEENEHSDRGHEEYRETCPTCREEREKAETAKKPEPEFKGPQYREKVELNKAQVRVLDILHERILLEDGLGERFVAEYEGTAGGHTYQLDIHTKKLGATWITREAQAEVELRHNWCECGKDEFHSYPEDGQCVCGMHKHHVHCTCGGVMQVG